MLLQTYRYLHAHMPIYLNDNISNNAKNVSHVVRPDPPWYLVFRPIFLHRVKGDSPYWGK